MFHMILDDAIGADVHWSEEDEGFIATALDLPGCSAFGETQQEALTELQSAMVAWIKAARAAGNPIPDRVSQVEFNSRFFLPGA